MQEDTARKVRLVELTFIAGGEGTCRDGTCPTVWGTEGEDVLVQGFKIADHGLEIPAGEEVVRLPREVILAAARALGSEP